MWSFLVVHIFSFAVCGCKSELQNFYPKELHISFPISYNYITSVTIFLQLHGVEMETTPEASFEFYKLRTDLGDNPGAQNHTHRPVPVINDNAVYMWKYMALLECSVTCGRGLRILEPRCVDVDYPDRALLDEVCEHQLQVPKPLPLIQPCQLQTCPPL